MQFRHDINGLRAYAVLFVVIFHFNKDWLPGGFIGVDVFFVISGYLMTGIIFTNIQRNTFSLSGFYLARANRIIPALSALCISTLIAGLIILAPEDLKVLGKHIAYSASFISNIAYQAEAGYFDVASHDKWLLHTWSLSVEWQFYLVYPLIVLLFRKLFDTEKAKAGILLTTVSSLILCIYLSYTPEVDAFYNLSSRAWEMMAGGIAFLYPLALSRSNARMAGYFGLLLIILSAFLLNQQITWPALYTLIPVVGTWLVITANQQKSLATKAYVFQKIGNWSYSVYLWHWPLYVIGNKLGLTSTEWLITGIAISILLGYLSYTFIEQKVHLSKNTQGKNLLTHPVLIIMFITTIMGLVVENSDGYPDRFPKNVRDTFLAVQSSPLREKCHSKVNDPIPPEEACTYFGEHITWAVLGDSHTVEISYVLAEHLKENNEGVRHYSFSGCAPSYKQKAGFNKCTKWLNLAVDDLKSRENIESVLINFRYPRAFYGDSALSNSDDTLYPSETDRSKMYWSLNEMIRDIASHKRQVYVILPIPELKERIANILSSQYTIGQQEFGDIRGESRTYFMERSQPIFDFFAGITLPDNVKLIDPSDIFCDRDNCYAVREGVPLYFDDDHPSLDAARLMLAPAIKTEHQKPLN